MGKANPLMRIFGDYCEDIASLRRLTKKKRRDAKLLTTLLTPRAFGCTTRDLFGSAILVEPSSDIAAHKKGKTRIRRFYLKFRSLQQLTVNTFLTKMLCQHIVNDSPILVGFRFPVGFDSFVNPIHQLRPI